MKKHYTLEELLLAGIFALQVEFDGSLEEILDMVLSRGQAALEVASERLADDGITPADRAIVIAMALASRSLYRSKFDLNENEARELLEQCLKSTSQ